MANYSDDENPNHEARENSIGSKVEVIHGDKVDVRISHMKVVPMLKTELNVAVELTGSAQSRDINRRLGVDIVVMLDLSSSMSRNERRQYLQTSMEFLISKLCPIDRVSVVKLSSSSAERLCSLRLMTEDAQGDIENMVKSVQVSTEDGPVNLAGGLEEALKVLNDRAYFQGRKPALMVLSSSDATYDAAQVPLRDVPLHAFAIGSDCTHHVLKEIATKSNGGTFSVLDFKETKSISDLSPMFSECLDKLLTVVVQDLKLSLTPLKENYANETEVIVEGETEVVMDAKYHHQAESDETGSITVSLGNLYRQERCKVLVKLTLPAVKEQVNARVLQITYSYREGVESCDGGPIAVTVSRMKPASHANIKTGKPMISATQRDNIGKGVQFYDEHKNDFISLNDKSKAGRAPATSRILQRDTCEKRTSLLSPLSATQRDNIGKGVQFFDEHMQDFISLNDKPKPGNKDRKKH